MFNYLIYEYRNTVQCDKLISKGRTLSCHFGLIDVGYFTERYKIKSLTKIKAKSKQEADIIMRDKFPEYFI